MPLFEAVRMALRTIVNQKLKSFFSLIGVLIGVTFLIAVVSTSVAQYFHDGRHRRQTAEPGRDINPDTRFAL